MSTVPYTAWIDEIALDTARRVLGPATEETFQAVAGMQIAISDAIVRTLHPDLAQAFQRVVPVDPTPAMLHAARSCPMPAVLCDSRAHAADLQNRERWRAMLAAAPGAKTA